jgi:hypothetical protein
MSERDSIEQLIKTAYDARVRAMSTESCSTSPMGRHSR